MEETKEGKRESEPWVKFAGLGDALAAGEIGFRGPGQRLHTTSGETTTTRFLPHGLENTGGGPAHQPSEVVEFAKRQMAQVRHQDFAPKSWLPDCARDSIVMGDSPEQLLKKLIDRVRQNPSEQRVRDVQAIANELSRSHEGAALVRKILTPELLLEATRLICKGEQ